MKKLIDNGWDHILFERDEKLILSVICGTVALFDINIILNEEERSAFEKHGQEYIKALAEDIRNYPENFSERSIRV